MPPLSNRASCIKLFTQLGYICILGDDKRTVVPISFKSYKSRCNTRSATADEVIPFNDLFDVAAVLAAELSVILCVKISLQRPTDSKSLFNVISKGSRTSQKSMMLDIEAAREGFMEKRISDIGFVRSSCNVADGLTKPMQQRSLQAVLMTGKLDMNLEQWIIRN